MTQNVSISVALCTCNGKNYIGNQIQSIIDQTVKVDEIICFDDHSDDDTIEIINSYKNQNPDINFRIQSNIARIGVSRNFDQAILYCRSDIVLLADQDDIWLPHKVETIIDFFSSHPLIDVVFTDAFLIDENNQRFSNTTLFRCLGFDKEAMQMFDDGLGAILFCKGIATGATMALRRNNYESICKLLKNSPFLHDGLISIRAFSVKSIAYLNVPLIEYRQHSYQQIGVAYHIQHPLSSERMVQTYPLGYENIPFMIKNFTWGNHDKNLLLLMQRRVQWLENPLGLFHYLFNFINGTYNRIFSTHKCTFLKYDMRYWLLLRVKRFRQKFALLKNPISK